MSRTLVVAGNWKMNLGAGEAARFLAELRVPAVGSGVEVVLFPPAATLGALHGMGRTAAAGRPVFGAQNVHWEAAGAFTGETSVPIAASVGATHCLVGHSERRQVFGETDSEVARKMTAVLGHGLVPVVCVGETLEERRGGLWEEVILGQVDAALGALSAAGAEHPWMLAYEPVWAIGTGETATPEDAGAAHAVIRGRLAEAIGTAAGGVPILYGGSVKPENAATLLARPEIDGVLVGGASLDPTAFNRIIGAAESELSTRD